MNAKKLTVLSLFTAISLVIFIIEAQLPTIIPIPGIKPGLANIIALITISIYKKSDTVLVLLTRIILSAVFCGSPITLLYSISGAVLCLLLMIPFNKIFGQNLIWVTSVFGAMAHNIGQLITAIVITSEFSIITYLPFLLISAIITGIFTGLCAKFVLQRLDIKNEIN